MTLWWTVWYLLSYFTLITQNHSNEKRSLNFLLCLTPPSPLPPSRSPLPLSPSLSPPPPLSLPLPLSPCPSWCTQEQCASRCSVEVTTLRSTAYMTTGACRHSMWTCDRFTGLNTVRARRLLLAKIACQVKSNLPRFV